MLLLVLILKLADVEDIDPSFQAELLNYILFPSPSIAIESTVLRLHTALQHRH